MNLAPDLAQELNSFPPVLRALIDAELAAGNSIVEMGHSFPAPPVGAYVKLANNVSTRARATGEGLSFHERSGSGYSGAFTDAKRFHFVLEPPNPLPPSPDMDAIRRSNNPEPADGVTLTSEREGSRALKRRTMPPQLRAIKAALGMNVNPPEVEVLNETATGVTRFLHFRDPRPPQEIQFGLERSLMLLFTAEMEHGRFVLRGKTTQAGANYSFELRFDAALPRNNYYMLKVEASWPKEPDDNHDYYRKSAEGWFKFWTRDFEAAQPPAADESSPIRYQKLCDAAWNAEAHLDTVPALQQAIVAAMKAGASFATAHKEGGTTLRWLEGRFVRSDYGDDPGGQTYPSETAFLIALRKFYDWETSKSYYPGKAPDLDAWKLIRRLLRTP